MYLPECYAPISVKPKRGGGGGGGGRAYDGDFDIF